VKLSKLALAVGLGVAIIASAGGCSKSDDKEPKVAGGDLPNAHPIGRGAGAPGKPAGGPGNAAPVARP